MTQIDYKPQIAVRIAMTDEAYEYYKGINLTAIVDEMLDYYSILDIPQTSSTAHPHYKDVVVTNKEYLRLRTLLGPRNPMINLSKLFEWGYVKDYLTTAGISKSPQSKITRKSDLLRAKLLVLKAKAILQKYNLQTYTEDLIDDLNTLIMEVNVDD